MRWAARARKSGSSISAGQIVHHRGPDEDPEMEAAQVPYGPDRCYVVGVTVRSYLAWFGPRVSK